MFEDMTMIHEGMLRSCRGTEGNQKFGLVLDQNHVLHPARWAGGGSPASISENQTVLALD
jgi:hypothetical protein